MKINIEEYWLEPPPEPSPRLPMWMEKIRNGWKPNGRIRGMGYYESAEFFGVYIWEYLHVLAPAIRDYSWPEDVRPTNADAD